MNKPLTAALLVLCMSIIWLTAIRGDTPSPAAHRSDVHPAVAAFFESKDPFVQEVVLPNIEANRKCDAVLTVVDGEGKPLAGAAISATLKRHEFLFGH